MRIARLLTETGPIRGTYRDGVVHADDGDYEVGVDGPLLPPCEPSALYCVGRNFTDTLEQKGYERPEAPDFFIKPPTAVIAHERPVVYPAFTDELTYAGELAAVIDRRCRNVSVDEVSDVVRGYTILNDLDALDQHGVTERKAFDGSGPLGPWIETDVDPFDLDMWTDIAGERRQESNTSQMLFDPDELVSYLSHRFTFRPGDVVSFGSPGNPGVVEPGDTIEMHYEGIGTLRNTVVTSRDQRSA
ncbi:fumarylacetoacetate hydrolase family protein [Haloarcula marina]|uniref:fumarylacetoacetate hydrolase family protein n=1 Tax=Haloarcula marina TaxID=2961574 RepID=UPI0020B8334A|nr:fumarylacetoacetate hydrolase family protein [Halomicroarcula marina]